MRLLCDDGCPEELFELLDKCCQVSALISMLNANAMGFELLDKCCQAKSIVHQTHLILHTASNSVVWLIAYIDTTVVSFFGP